jgi:predicted nucleic acid-binding protein
LLDVTRHTANEYAILKANLAKTYLAKALRRDRPRWLENWVDRATGQVLQVDENDLWMCAQARERNLVLITADAKMGRITKADSLVRLHII